MALGVTPGRGSAQDLGTNLFSGTGSVFIPYANAQADGRITSPPQVNVSFGDDAKHRKFTMDTGSTGIVVSRDVWDPVGLTSVGAGQITYSSSGIIQNGQYYSTPVRYYDGGTVVATATVPVLVVDNQTCTANPRNCQPNANPTGVSQMGVGFGQELAGQPTGTPDKNPFLNITGAAAGGALPSAGYVVTSTGVRLGLTEADTRGFALVKLAPFPQYSAERREWVLAPASVSVNGTLGSGAVLSDTGVVGMYLTPPTGATVGTAETGAECGRNCAVQGTTIRVFLPGQGSAVASYGFTVGADGGNQVGNATSPNFVSVDASSTTTFVNTTVNFFNGFDYLYDAASGFVGYRATGAVSPADAGATPSMALQGEFTVVNGFRSSLPTYLLDSFQVATSTGRGFYDQAGMGVRLTAAGTSSFTGPLSGPGSLTIGGGTVLLAGSNTYTGATAIDAGAVLGLQGAGSIGGSAGLTANGTFDISGTTAGAAITALSGSGQVRLGAQQLTLTNADGGFSGVIADGGLSGGVGGSLAVSGGTQTLTAASTYTGTTRIDAGATLALAGAGGIAASSGVTANGTLDVSGAGASIAGLSGAGTVRLGAQALTLTAASGHFSGVITDGGLAGGAGGQLVVAGGAQTLSGTNSYGGGTVITGGAVLAVTSDAALGAPGGGVTFDNGTLQALGNLSSTRPVTITTGGGTIDANGYQISLSGPVAVDGALATRGAVQLHGGGVVAGAVSVHAGTTAVNGLLQAASMTVHQDAALRGTGTIAAPTTVYGTLAPGNSPGTLVVTAPVTLAAGSTSQFDIDGPGTGTGAGSYSRLIVTGGNSFTAGGTLAPVLRGITAPATNLYAPAVGQLFTVVTADGGVQESYAGLAQPAGLAPGTRFDTLYGATALALVVTPATYANLAPLGIAQTANQSAVGGALDSLRPVPGVRAGDGIGGVLANLYPLPAQAITPTLDGLAGKGFGDTMLNNLEAQRLVTGAVSDQLASLRGGVAAAGARSTPNAWGGTSWLRGLGQWTRLGDSDGAAGYGATNGGVAVGADIRLGGWVTGAALAYTGGGLSSRDNSRANTQALHLTGYAGWTAGALFAEAQVGGNWAEDDVRRQLGVFGGEARSTAYGAGVSGQARIGAVLDVAGIRVEPSAGFSVQTFNWSSLTEQALGPLALSVRDGSVSSVRSILGARAERSFMTTRGITLTPSVALGWRHEFSDVSASTAASFLGGGAPFSVTTARFGRDALTAGMALTAQVTPALALFAAYDADLRRRWTAQAVTAGLRYNW